MSAPDGGPAFPVDVTISRFDGHVSHEHIQCEGMSLRDYFAAKALEHTAINVSWTDNPAYWEGVARGAYVCADAMLEARKR